MCGERDFVRVTACVCMTGWCAPFCDSQFVPTCLRLFVAKTKNSTLSIAIDLASDSQPKGKRAAKQAADKRAHQNAQSQTQAQHRNASLNRAASEQRCLSGTCWPAVISSSISSWLCAHRDRRRMEQPFVLPSAIRRPASKEVRVG